MVEPVGETPPPPTPFRPAYEIRDHVLADAPFVKCPDQGEMKAPRYVLLQSTLSGADYDDADDEDRPLSGHLVVTRRGAVIQLNPFDRSCSYAGPSGWRGVAAVDRCSIGIWLDNYGPLWRDGENEWRTVADNVQVPRPYVYAGAHRLGGQYGGWEVFPHRQVQALRALIRSLCRAYPSIQHVVGIDAAAPHRAYDPGPALPLPWILHRQPFAQPTRGVAVAPLNVYAGPGTGHYLTSWTIQPGVEAQVLQIDGEWALVEFDPERGAARVSGWVHTRFLRTEIGGNT